MTGTDARVAEFVRRTRLARLVCRCSLRYLARNGSTMSWRDRLAFPVAIGAFLSFAFLAPELLSDDATRELSPHTPVSVR